MTGDRLQRSLEVFDAAAELPAGEQERFVLDACGDDPQLRDRVLAMLGADRRASPLLDSAPNELAAALAAAPPSLEGRRVGPYRILRLLGRGGMGIVYLARRDDVDKVVALKLVAGGLGSPDRIARFLQERRVLAQLEHPNIARLLDAGVEDDGTPWLAMDYVPGEPIDVFCDTRRLSVHARLSLFERVCGAVGYAHRHLVVHRDLKPSNILVAADGEPRLVDFGIAKLLDDASGTGESLTQTGSLPLTPQYASPEQLSGTAITTASDIYQLGALLFELLTGRPPHPERLAKFGGRTHVAISRPSSVAAREWSRNFDAEGRPAATASDVAAARQSTPERLRKRLSGDLDNIILRATQIEPQHRYATTDQLADDVRRHREGLPVLARPASAAYRLSRFVRRHKAGTAVASLAVVVLVGFVLAMALQARRIEAQRIRAEEVSTLLSELFAGADPTVTQGDTVTVATLLERGVDRVRSGLTQDNEVKARLLWVIASAYHNLGQPARTTELASEALGLMRVSLPADDRTRLASLGKLAYWHALAGDSLRARSLVDEGLSVARRLPRARRHDLARILQADGFVRQVSNDSEGARRSYEAALVIYRALPLSDEIALGIEETLVNLGYLAQGRRDLPAAEASWREVLQRRRQRLGASHSLTAKAMLDLSGVLVQLNNLDEAEQMVRDAVAVQRRVFRGPHIQVSSGLIAYARVLSARGKYPEAEAAQREALQVTAQLWGDTSSVRALAIANLAGYVERQGRLQEAERLHREALQLYVKSQGHRSVSTAIVMTNLAYNAYLSRRLRASDSIYRLALPILDSAWKGTSGIARTLVDFATVLRERGSCAAAEPHARRAMTLLLRENLSDRALQPQRVLGGCLTELGRYAEAESLLVDVHQKLLQSRGPQHEFTTGTARELVGLYQRWGKPEKARSYLPALKGTTSP